VSATNRDLKELIGENRFRDDLYYRLNCINIELPDLKDRGEDLLIMANVFLRRYAATLGKRVSGLTKETSRVIRAYAWPGNIRELKNLVQRLLILGSGDEIELVEVERAISAQQPAAAAGAVPELPYDLPLREAREQFEYNYLVHQLQAVGGSIGKLAKRVGMERTHLYRKLRSLGIDHKKGNE